MGEGCVGERRLSECLVSLFVWRRDCRSADRSQRAGSFMSLVAGLTELSGHPRCLIGCTVIYSPGVGLQARHRLGGTVELSQVYGRSMLPHTHTHTQHHVCIIYQTTRRRVPDYSILRCKHNWKLFFLLFSDVK